MSNKRNLLGLLISLIIGLLFDKLLLESSLGLGFSIFMLSTIILYFIMLKSKLKFKYNFGLVLLISALIMILYNTIYTNQVISSLDILLLPIVMTASAILIYYNETEYYRFAFIGDLLSHMFFLPLKYISKPFTIIKESLPKKNQDKLPKIKPEILIGLVISVPILFVVILLLSSADLVFQQYLRNIGNLFPSFKDLNVYSTLRDIIVILIVAMYFFSFVWSFTARETSPKYETSNYKLDSLILAVPVSILNIIYLVFSIVQFSYLYGGSSLPQGFSYADYARKGFFELVAVTIINFIIILYGLSFSRTENIKVDKTCRVLYTLLIAFTVNLLFSAHYKMRLYEKAYGYTYLRVYVDLFMVLLFILCILALTSLWYKSINLIKGMILCSLVFYTLLNILNVDAFIARENIKIYNSTGKIDAYYITNLSYEAVPYMIELANNSDTETQKIVKEQLKLRKQRLDSSSNFKSFNLSKYKAEKLLKNY